MGKDKIEANDYESFRDMVLHEQAQGNIVVMGIEGPMIAPLDEVIKQPTSGLLYDLNRDVATILTFIEDRKWVNDYASTQVIIALKAKLDKYENK